MIPNVTDNKYTSVHSLSLMLVQLNVESYNQMLDKNKFIDALTIEGQKIDFNLLQACLNVYRPPEKNTKSSMDAIQSTFLAAFKQNVARAMSYLDIDNNGIINKAEFVQGMIKVVKNFDQSEFESLLSIIARDSSAREISVATMKAHFDKFMERQIEMKKNEISNGRSTAENFEVVREKIKRFFNMDTSVFYQDLKTFDLSGKGKIKFTELTYYLSYTTLQLTDDDQKTLALTFHAVASTELLIDYVTSMIFFGRANSHTLGEVEMTLIQKVFFSQIREEMNLNELSSFDIFQGFLAICSQGGDNKTLINKLDLQAIVNRKQIGLSTEEINELYNLIADGATEGFDYRVFRTQLYGRELNDITWLVFSLDERLRSQQIELHSYFFKDGQLELTCRELGKLLIGLDPEIRFDTVDMLFTKLDKNGDNRVDVKEVELLFTEHSVLLDFKQCLVRYGEKSGKDLSEILSLTDNYDTLLKEDFRRLVREVTENTFTEDEIGRMFRLLDKDNDGGVSKIEMKEILDIAQKQLYNSREFLTFKNGVIQYCESKNITLRQIFERFADRTTGIITKIEIKKMAEETLNFTGVQSTLISKTLDSNLNDTIDYSEFKEAILGTSGDDISNLIVSIKRILANKNEDFHTIFKSFDTDNNDMLDPFEFKNFTKKLNLRLSFVQSELLFYTLDLEKKNFVSKKDFFSTLVADTMGQTSSKSIAMIIQQFKSRVGLW
jgi:Ca2+-binding EF-hand superfamily protein